MWEQVSKIAHVAWKEQSCAVPSAPKRTNCLQAWNKSSPIKRRFGGSAHPRVLSASRLKDLHGFVTRGKGMPPHVQTACVPLQYMCCSGTLLPLAKAYKVWVGCVFLQCGSKSQKLLTSLAKNKVMQVLRPQSRQTACGFRTNPPLQYLSKLRNAKNYIM